jgi:hypothetical protein
MSSGCSDSKKVEEHVPSPTFEGAVSDVSGLTLEETASVINVWPMVRLDPSGGFLIADMSEHAVRRYSSEGELHFTIGRQGDGPGEFKEPTVALRLPSEEILAIDMRGRAAIFDSDGHGINRTATLPVRAIEDAELVNDSLVVLAGVAVGGGGVELSSARLHLWDFRRDTVLSSFFVPQIGSDIKDAATMARWANLAIRGDTIAATFALQDTIFLFLTNGRQIGKIPLPTKHFRRATPAPNEIRTDVRARSDWVGSFHFISSIEWIHDGFIVQYQGFDNMTPYYNLIRLTKQGDPLFETQNSPRLLLVDGSRAYFVDPAAEVPNKWIVGTLR